MTHKKLVTFVAVFSLVGVTALSTSAYAHELAEAHTHPTEAKQQTPEQLRLIEERKAALHDKMAAAKEARMNKLEDKRLEICEKRQDKINSIMHRGAEQSNKHLAVFQKIEEKVKQFYVDKNLTAEGYDAAVANADEKETVAIAAIEATLETSFDCETADGAKPGDATRELMKDRHEALKAYRTAIKDLILVVKKGHGQQQSADQSTEESEQE